MEYAQKALILAHDVDGLVHLRQTLRAEMEASPLMDEPGLPAMLKNLSRHVGDLLQGECAMKAVILAGGLGTRISEETI
jgi:hypothetical protein